MENIRDYDAIEQDGCNIRIKNLRHFALAETLDCGQAFRFAAHGESLYTGIAHGRRITMTIANSPTAADLILHDTTMDEFDRIWKKYLDLDRAYTQIHQQMSESDLKEIFAFSTGLRLLHQDAWEIIISFIISQNNNIPRIKSIIDALCRLCGTALPCGGFTFPTAEAIVATDITAIKCGYRLPYIRQIAEKFAKKQLENLCDLPTQELRKTLLAQLGIGPKVADCILLFGYGRVDVFPIDVWIGRMLTTVGPVHETYPHIAGIVQQFLFRYATNISFL